MNLSPSRDRLGPVSCGNIAISEVIRLLLQNRRYTQNPSISAIACLQHLTSGLPVIQGFLRSIHTSRLIGTNRCR
jgi:hypothetical protein